MNTSKQLSQAKRAFRQADRALNNVVFEYLAGHVGSDVVAEARANLAEARRNLRKCSEPTRANYVLTKLDYALCLMRIRLYWEAVIVTPPAELIPALFVEVR